MKHPLGHLLHAVGIGILALILIAAASVLFPASGRVATLIVVVAGTALLAMLRWDIWPFHRQSDLRRPDEETPLSELGYRRRLQLGVSTALFMLLPLAWIVAWLTWQAYEDAASRSLILRALVRTTAVSVSAAMLTMPPLRNGLRRGGYQVVLGILLGSAWLAGTILLPSVCAALEDACHHIDQFVFAIPGWSFLPVAALLLRSIGSRLGVALWRFSD